MSQTCSIMLTVLFAALLPACETRPSETQAPWTLVWSDEFNDEAIDPHKWSFEVNCWGGGNNERQCYTDRPDNAAIENGELVITARHETWTGPAYPAHFQAPEYENQTSEGEYTSARLVTRGLAAWTYGRFEIRAQLPSGLGTWPAIWMMPEDSVYGGWAASGEIDIMEAINFGIDCEDCESGQEDRVYGTLHYGSEYPGNTHTGEPVSLNQPDAFHTYAIEWTPSYIAWFVDGLEYARQTPDDWHTDGDFVGATSAAPFDQPFHMILNLAIGGNWPESQNPGIVSYEGFPKSMRIDYVRVYACQTDFTPQGQCPNNQ